VRGVRTANFGRRRRPRPASSPSPRRSSARKTALARSLAAPAKGYSTPRATFSHHHHPRATVLTPGRRERLPSWPSPPVCRVRRLLTTVVRCAAAAVAVFVCRRVVVTRFRACSATPRDVLADRSATNPFGPLAWCERARISASVACASSSPPIGATLSLRSRVPPV